MDFRGIPVNVWARTIRGEDFARGWLRATPAHAYRLALDLPGGIWNLGAMDAVVAILTVVGTP